MGRPSASPQVCGPLRPEDAERIASLGLYFNQPESAILCLECGFALKTDGDRVSRHLGEKHGIPRKARCGLNKLINSLQLPDPHQLPPRQDGSPQHPHLTLQKRPACAHCLFRSTSLEILSRHLKKQHRREITARRSSRAWFQEHIQDGILFQSWLSGDILAAWRVSTSAADATDLAVLAVRDAELDREAEAFCAAELHHLTSASLSTRATTRTMREQPSPVLVSNWMRRTQWESLFVRTDRRLLIALYRTPAVAPGSYYLGAYGNVQLESPAQDESRLHTIMQALDRLFDRCADTVVHTDTAIRRWLRGRFVDRPYKAPFQLVAHKRSERQYRRLLKRCICMWLRLWLMPRCSAKALTRRTITFEQAQALQKLWEDPVWLETDCTIDHVPDWGKGLRATSRGPGAAFNRGTNAEDTLVTVSGGEGNDSIASMLSGSETESEHGSDSDGSDEECSDYQNSSDDDSDDNEEPMTPFSSFAEPGQSNLVHGIDENNGQEEYAIPQPTQDRQLDVVLRFCLFMAMEEFDDGQASSTLLVFFSAVCGLSGDDGSEFARPATFSTYLSGLIYCTRLIILEGTLPRVAHDYIDLPARPKRGQLELLARVRREKMCDGTLLPLGEFISLVAYGISLSRADGPAFLFEWSEDGEEISWDGINHLTMDGFRGLLAAATERVAKQTKQMLYSWQPPKPQFRELRDRISERASGYSFVTDPTNGLSGAYVQLVRRACTAPMDGLLRKDRAGGGTRLWDLRGVMNYVQKHDELLKDLMIAVHGHGGQGSRISELLTLRRVNTPSQLRGVVVHLGSICCITRHVKSRLSTNNEFQVARFSLID